MSAVCTLLMRGGHRLVAQGGIEEIESALWRVGARAASDGEVPFATFRDEESKDFRVRPGEVVAVIRGTYP